MTFQASLRLIYYLLLRYALVLFLELVVFELFDIAQSTDQSCIDLGAQPIDVAPRVKVYPMLIVS